MILASLNMYLNLIATLCRCRRQRNAQLAGLAADCAAGGAAGGAAGAVRLHVRLRQVQRGGEVRVGGAEGVGALGVGRGQLRGSVPTAPLNACGQGTMGKRGAKMWTRTHVISAGLGRCMLTGGIG